MYLNLHGSRNVLISIINLYLALRTLLIIAILCSLLISKCMLPIPFLLPMYNKGTDYVAVEL